MGFGDFLKQFWGNLVIFDKFRQLSFSFILFL